MLFKRRDKQSLLNKTLNLLWPQMGWKRTFVYIKHRVLRLPHSTRDIAMGLAAGCVVSWTPTLGIQILQCFIFCKIFRANFLASVLGTTFGNPWTFPILFWIAYMVGDFFLNITGLENYFVLVAGDTVGPNNQEHGVNAFIPTLVGGYIMAFITFPAFYYGFYYFIQGARAAKIRVSKRVHVVAEKVHDIKEHRKEVKAEKKRDLSD